MFYSVKARNEVKSALLMNANEVNSTYVWNSINRSSLRMRVVTPFLYFYVIFNTSTSYSIGKTLKNLKGDEKMMYIVTLSIFYSVYLLNINKCKKIYKINTRATLN